MTGSLRWTSRNPEPVESDGERRARIAAERILIEEAEREIEEGRGIEGDAAREVLRAFAEGRPVPTTCSDEAERR